MFQSKPMPEPTEVGPHLTVTRLRLRWTHVFVLAQFLNLPLKGARAAQTSPGFMDGALWVDARLTFWTVTLWQGEASMRAYACGPVHLGAMRHLREHSSAYTEAAFASGVSPTLRLPTALETHAFLTARATFYALPRASSDQRTGRIRAPNVQAVQRLEPA